MELLWVCMCLCSFEMSLYLFQSNNPQKYVPPAPFMVQMHTVWSVDDALYTCTVIPHISREYCHTAWYMDANVGVITLALFLCCYKGFSCSLLFLHMHVGLVRILLIITLDLWEKKHQSGKRYNWHVVWQMHTNLYIM